MVRVLRLAVLGLVIALVIAQAVPVDTSNPPVAREVSAPTAVREILRRACYDCHSNETVWPPYATIAPISWLVSRDVHEGRAELNFSAWEGYTDAIRRKKLKETVEEIVEGEMPPWYYTLMHPEAALGADEVAAVRVWTAQAGGEPVRSEGRR